MPNNNKLVSSINGSIMMKIKSYLVFLVFLLISSIAQSAEMQGSVNEINIGEILNLLRLYMIIGGLFVAIVAALGIWVFGFDVRRTRIELDEVKKEVNEKKDAINELHSELLSTVKDMHTQKEEFEEFISKTRSNMTDQENSLKEFVADTESEIEQFVGSAQDQIDSIATEIFEFVKPQNDDLIKVDDGMEDIQAIKQIIKTSNFKWTSIKRIISKTGLERNVILKLARHSGDIIIGVGKDSADHIFRIV